MADEPRRSGRATKGQHKGASSSPAPQPKPTKTAKTKATKQSQEPEPDADEEEEMIRCICGDQNPNDKRVFICCDTCEVWQHNICMGLPDDEDEQPDHYFCEEDGPEDHAETLAAMARGEKIWETRNKIYQNEKKAGAKRKGKTGGRPGWLKKDIQFDPEAGTMPEQDEVKSEEGAGSKRKRGDEGEPMQVDVKEEPEEKITRGSRQDKRRKSAIDEAADPETALVDIDKLPADRNKIATALSKIIADELQARVKAGSFRIPDGHTAKSLGDYYATRIEYALKMNHGETKDQNYQTQFRMLHANLKKNKLLITRLLNSSLTADELSTMSSSDMASEELQKERAVMKEQLDRQAVAVPQDEGPKYRRTHKGDELIEDENKMLTEGTRSTAPQPVRERGIVQQEAGSPTGEQSAGSPSEQPLRVDTVRSQSQTGLEQRRTSSQQFDMNNIWAKTAGSPTSATPSGGQRLMQMPPRRRSSKPNLQQQDSAAAGGGTKEDADVDRMLQDEDDETYSPAEYAETDGVVWRGKLIQSADAVSPTVNARFVAGRDLTSTVRWRDLLPSQLSIDGRLQTAKAEEYLCSLQWSQSSDVSVLALTPHDDADGFEAVFQYFKTRGRYAVINKDKPPMVKDLYIIPVEQGQEVPSHVGMLEYNRLGGTVGEKCLLASLVIGRAVGTPPTASASSVAQPQPSDAASNATNGGQQHTLPQHMRASASGPAGSPLNVHSATFSPPTTSTSDTSPFPPNPYSGPSPAPAPVSTNPLVMEILGNLRFAPTAVQVVGADPQIPREKLEHLKRILEEDPGTRTDIGKLAEKLMI